jgi:prepilin-type N-terminal cleavage/methylation domain-containing protein
MKPSSISRTRGFTLLETVIAIGVLAVLLTGFMVVFAPAADGIRKSINVQQADRLASALEQNLVTLRKGEAQANIVTGFDKSFDWIMKSGTANTAVMVYQYRGEIGGGSRSPDDGTPKPVADIKGKLPGKDYTVIPMVRRKSDSNFNDDLPAIEGPVYLVKCTQLVFGALPAPATGDGLIAGEIGKIKNPKPKPSTPTVPAYEAGPFSTAADYPEAVIAFSAEFYQMPAKTKTYFDGAAFTTKFSTLKSPVFTRNLAVRR